LDWFVSIAFEVFAWSGVILKALVIAFMFVLLSSFVLRKSYRKWNSRPKRTEGIKTLNELDAHINRYLLRTEELRERYTIRGYVMALLKPQLPIRDGIEPRSWFGGKPRLPDDAPWPSIEGKPLCFLAQICCADLPKEVWEGLGPRVGWLVVFITASWPPKPKILFVNSLGPPAVGPENGVAEWYWNQREFANEGFRRSPKWPVDIEPLVSRPDAGLTDHPAWTRSPTKFSTRPLEPLGEYADNNELARVTYCESPELMLPHSKDYWEKFWQSNIANEICEMGESPELYLSMGEEKYDTILLELRSSWLMGWKWDDLNNLIFLVNRDDLAACRFTDIKLKTTADY
jgi:Domain of unknown function (DUF1963)